MNKSKKVPHDLDDISLDSYIDIVDFKTKKPRVKESRSQFKNEKLDEIKTRTQSTKLKTVNNNVSTKTIKSDFTPTRPNTNLTSKKSTNIRKATESEKQTLLPLNSPNTVKNDIPKPRINSRLEPSKPINSGLKKAQSTKNVSFDIKDKNNLKSVKSTTFETKTIRSKHLSQSEIKPIERETLLTLPNASVPIQESIFFKHQKLFNCLDNFFNFSFLGLLYYLFYKYLIDLFLKHLIYFIISLKFRFNLEYFLVIIYGLCHSLIIIFLYAKILSNSPRLEFFKLLFLAVQLAVFILFGLVQFICGMNIWDHKYKIYAVFNAELTKFIIQLIWLLTASLFQFAKFYYSNKKFIVK